MCALHASQSAGLKWTHPLLNVLFKWIWSKKMHFLNLRMLKCICFSGYDKCFFWEMNSSTLQYIYAYRPHFGHFFRTLSQILTSCLRICVYATSTLGLCVGQFCLLSHCYSMTLLIKHGNLLIYPYRYSLRSSGLLTFTKV